MRLLGLDLGSTSIKVGVLDLAQGAVAQVRSVAAPAPVDGLPPAWFEIDPHAVTRIAQQLLAAAIDTVGACHGILTCSQMGGVILTDAAGRAVTNYLSWRDQRTLEPHPSGNGSYFDALQRRTDPADDELTGRELKPGATVSLLYWLNETGRIPPEAVQAMTLAEYVVAQLGRTSPRVEPTLALGTLNLTSRDWHRDWFARLGFGQLQWPELADVSEPVGRFRYGSQAIPLYPAVGDQQAALFGAELREEELSLNVSTGSQVSQLTDRRESGNFQLRPYFGGKLLKTITHVPAGRALNALVDLLTELARREGHPVRDPWTIIAEQSTGEAEDDLEVDLAFFACPVGDRGHIANIRLENLSIGSLFRGAFRNMADNYLECALRLSPQRHWQRMVLSGSLPQKFPTLRTLIIDRLELPFRTVETPEETLLGLLRLAESIVR